MQILRLAASIGSATSGLIRSNSADFRRMLVHTREVP